MLVVVVWWGIGVLVRLDVGIGWRWFDFLVCGFDGIVWIGRRLVFWLCGLDCLRYGRCGRPVGGVALGVRRVVPTAEPNKTNPPYVRFCGIRLVKGIPYACIRC